MLLSYKTSATARRRADLQEILARFTGQNTQLLSFDEVREKLKIQGSAERGVKDIPLDAIVGSVGRYADFTRDFLPRDRVSQIALGYRQDGRHRPGRVGSYRGLPDREKFTL